MFMSFGKKKTSNWWILNFFLSYFVRNTAAGLLLIQFRANGAYKINFHLATPSCDCSAANRPRLKSADT
jgi:hypothetical protein